MEVLWHKITNLDAIQLEIGLPLNIDINGWQNKFEGYISKNMQNGHLKAQNRPLACALRMVVT